jgi:hypothetical protein
MKKETDLQIHGFLNLGIRWRWAVSFTPQMLYTWGNKPLYLLDSRLGGSQRESGHMEKKKISCPLPAIKLPFVSCQPCRHSLYWMNYHRSWNLSCTDVLFSSLYLSDFEHIFVFNLLELTETNAWRLWVPMRYVHCSITLVELVPHLCTAEKLCT